MATDRERKERWLSEEEAELWAYVVRDAKSLRRRRRKAGENHIIDGASDGETLSASASARNTPQPDSAKTGASSRTPAPSNPPPSSPPPIANFDWRQARRLANGHDDIEARLDLHGRRQHEAYAALLSFLVSCRTRGFRHVLVITGKGVRRPNGYGFDEERGVLRRLAPEWLREPEFRQMVVSFTESHERHGGEGALYIKLRRQK
jgi:DNA-nicking Smr family endonuclease